MSPAENAEHVIAIEEHERRRRAQTAESWLYRAVTLAPTIDVCEALLRGEKVPVSRLDPAWARRYGLR